MCFYLIEKFSMFNRKERNESDKKQKKGSRENIELRDYDHHHHHSRTLNVEEKTPTEQLTMAVLGFFFNKFTEDKRQ